MFKLENNKLVEWSCTLKTLAQKRQITYMSHCLYDELPHCLYDGMMEWNDYDGPTESKIRYLIAAQDISEVNTFPGVKR